MKKRTFRLIAALLTLCLGLLTAACAMDTLTPGGEQAPATGNAYLAIDINPSLELLIEDGKVTHLRALNDDAEVLLSGEELVGMTVEQASGRIVELAEELGYLNDNNRDVKITVAADDETLSATIESAAKNGAQKGSGKAVVNSDPRAADQKAVAELKAENPELYKNLTPAKLRLIEAIMAHDSTMTYEQGAALTIKALSERLDDLIDDFEDIVGDELEEKFNARVKERRTEIDAEIAAIYGEDYLAKWEQYSALEKLAEAMEKAAKHAAVSPEDLAALAELLGVEGFDRIAKDGVVSAERLEEYLDELEERLPDELKDSVERLVESILERYNEDAYELTEQELAAITEILGSVPEITTLEELETLLDTLEDEVEALRESIELTEEQKAALAAYRAEQKALHEEVRKEMKDDIAAAKNEFADRKAALKRK